MPNFLVVEYYTVEHMVQANTWEEAKQKVFDNHENQYSIHISYCNQKEGPDYSYIGEVSDLMNKERKDA